MDRNTRIVVFVVDIVVGNIVVLHRLIVKGSIPVVGRLRLGDNVVLVQWQQGMNVVVTECVPGGWYFVVWVLVGKDRKDERGHRQLERKVRLMCHLYFL